MSTPTGLRQCSTSTGHNAVRVESNENPLANREIPVETAECVATLRKRFNGPMSQAEIEMLRDFQGLIDFAIRNGLAFTMVLSILSHDINGIMQHGLSLEEARADGLSLQATSWAKASAEDVGEADEAE